MNVLENLPRSPSNQVQEVKVVNHATLEVEAEAVAAKATARARAAKQRAIREGACKFIQ